MIRASNDRLLTDRHIGESIDSFGSRFVDFANLVTTKAMAAIEKGYSNPYNDPDYSHWRNRAHYGFGRAPLELIAHVVENDLPYTEVLTADYIMANPMASEAYGSTTSFDDGEDPLEFRPSEIVSYYRDDDSKTIEEERGVGIRIIEPGNLWTDYPHAGILNTTVFLLRYPTTPTNRNRARSRWTYYHFLGLDIEKSASRTTDADALADTDNPTMKNPACTVCHSVMDPVAGAFQNYGERGEYRDEWGGKDSLDGLYKYPEDGSLTPYQAGDTWYRDMREPGFDGRIAPDSDNSLQWLAEQVVADDRFAEATVKFWWPAIMGVEVATPPEDENDSDFEAMLLTSNAQTAEVERLAEAFRTGIADREPYNLKDLLAEIMLSPWFRAETISDDNPVRTAALRLAGVERLLTPEELAWKTQAITGYVWGREPRTYLDSSGDITTNLTNIGQYRLLYGGIDSDGITDRVDDMTALMAAVAQSHAVESSCSMVQREFLLLPDEHRRLFGGIDKHVTPVSDENVTFEVTAEDWTAPQTVSFQVPLTPGIKTIRLAFTNDHWGGEGIDRNLYLDRIEVRSSNGNTVTEVEFESIRREQHCGTYWLSHNSYKMWSNCFLEIPVEIVVSDNYNVDVRAFQDRAGDEPARLMISVESDIETSRGAMEIRKKLVELHEKLLGVTVAVDSPEVDTAFQLFVEVWDRKRDDDDWRDESIECAINDRLYFEGIADDVLQSSPDENGFVYYDFNWDRVNEILDGAEWWGQGRQNPVVRTWVVVLAYFLTDYRYLFL